MKKVFEAAGSILDGKIAEAKYIHPYMFKQAEFVGEDYNGNKYYEIKKGVLYGRHRWFVPPDIFEYSPASVPPEWHGWLHNINNDAPSRVKFLEQSYKTPATTYKYLGYQPKGSYRQKMEFGRKRNWKKYEAWTPPAPAKA
ncbi:NADH:ubiquinone oxidoreductase [Chloropicon primus]|nr:NADH:ubiquinone oxidoreductase [Chloropicon primus]UPR00854.1 NADH:ubiquinone oxidoreductase [Chloropicon primus]|eukprot:QDZ21643.1 NADH:ubiquinone oxidoreductase [Chloropicon primus]